MGRGSPGRCPVGRRTSRPSLACSPPARPPHPPARSPPARRRTYPDSPGSSPAAAPVHEHVDSPLLHKCHDRVISEPPHVHEAAEALEFLPEVRCVIGAVAEELHVNAIVSLVLRTDQSSREVPHRMRSKVVGQVPNAQRRRRPVERERLATEACEAQRRGAAEKVQLRRRRVRHERQVVGRQMRHATLRRLEASVQQQQLPLAEEAPVA
eukprot:scaffold3951_cov258-Pinguiococcus_pyrenoidosus.AAC.5